MPDGIWGGMGKSSGLKSGGTRSIMPDGIGTVVGESPRIKMIVPSGTTDIVAPEFIPVLKKYVRFCYLLNL